MWGRIIEWVTEYEKYSTIDLKDKNLQMKMLAFT